MLKMKTEMQAMFFQLNELSLKGLKMRLMTEHGKVNVDPIH